MRKDLQKKLDTKENEHTDNISESIKLENIRNKKTPRKEDKISQQYGGILKKRNNRQPNKPERKNSVKWSILIDEEKKSKEKKNNNKKNRSFLLSKAVYKPYDGNDKYFNNLNKVNKIKSTDRVIKNIITASNESELQKDLETLNEKEHIFDEDLDEELKITLLNTIVNKFLKEFRTSNINK